MKAWRVTIHCSGTKNGVPVSAKEIDAWHRARGFDRLGYHMVFQPDGNVENGRGLNELGAHVKGANDGNIGLCLIGTDKFSRAQFSSLRYKLESLFLTYDIKKHNVFCHHQFESAIEQKKTCPNIPINHLLWWIFSDDDKVIRPYMLEGYFG